MQHHHRLVDALEQVMVETDFTELVDQDRGVGQRWIEQRRCNSVVLPEPRKPVISVTGVKSGGVSAKITLHESD